MVNQGGVLNNGFTSNQSAPQSNNVFNTNTVQQPMNQGMNMQQSSVFNQNNQQNSVSNANRQEPVAFDGNLSNDDNINNIF